MQAISFLATLSVAVALSFDKDVLLQPSECREDGDSCYDDRECCEDSVCVGGTYTTQGSCEAKADTLLFCVWSDGGARWIRDDTKCVQEGPPGFMCPRVGDPVKQSTAFMDDVTDKQLWDWNREGLVNCKRFALACTWTEAGADVYADNDNECFRGPEEKRLGKAMPLHCAVAGALVTRDQERRVPWGVGYLSWRKRRLQAGDKGYVQCNTAQQAYASWANRPIRAQLLQCGGIANRCITRLQAEERCRKWSNDVAVPGGPGNGIYGRGDLCYKHELGQTIGQTCTYAWTKDSKGKEGCYESNGNWETSEEAGGCRADAGVVRCRSYSEKKNETAVNYDSSDESFPLDPILQKGFDVACCDGHKSDPYFFYKNNFQSYKQEQQFINNVYAQAR